MLNSKNVCFLIGILFFLSFQGFKNWTNGLSGGDPNGYYIWLPSSLIYHDLTNPVKTLEVRRKVFNQPVRSMAEEGFNRPEGIDTEVYMNKYSMGMAVMYAPFFLVAHTLAPVLGYEQDCFSMIYRYLIFFNAVLYGFLGLLVLRQVLIRYFDDRTTAWTLATIGLATNLYFFSVWNTGMSHAASFFLFSLLLFFTEKWYRKPSFRDSIAVGLVYGLITLIRPTDAITVCIPVFWGITSFAALGPRLTLLKQNWTQVLTAMLCAIAVGLPQLIYWKLHTGKFFYYSYGSEGFDFKNPHLLEGIFGYQNGWLAYTPVMYLAILGIAWLWRSRNNYLLPVLFILPIQLYVIYSYWCWQWTNGFGARPMIQFYALLAIPLGGALAYAFSKKWLKWFAGGFVVFCALLNLSQAWQFDNGLLWTEMGNRRFFFSSMFKTELDENDLLYFDGAAEQPDTSKLELVKNLFSNGFEDSTGVNYISAAPHSGKFSFLVNQSKEFSPDFSMQPLDPEIKPGRWLKVSVWCKQTHEGINFYEMGTLVTYIGQKGEKLDYTSIRLGNKPSVDGSIWYSRPNVWSQVIYFVPIPKKILNEDLIKVYVWNPIPKDLFVDDLRVDLYK